MSIAESPLFLLPTRLVLATRLTPDSETVDVRCEWVADEATAAAHKSAGLPLSLAAHVRACGTRRRCSCLQEAAG